MKDNSSGLLFTQNEDGSVEIGVVDYGVEFFGGNDYECFFSLDKENAQNLLNALLNSPGGGLEEKLILKFGKHFDITSFEKLLNAEKIKYNKNTWF